VSTRKEGNGPSPGPHRLGTFHWINVDALVGEGLRADLFTSYLRVPFNNRYRAPLSSPLTPPAPSLPSTDRKGKRRALPSPSPVSSDLSPLDSDTERPPAKRTRHSIDKSKTYTESEAITSSSKGKGNAKTLAKGKKVVKKMPKKAK
jgi:hypothetical protein